MIAAVDRRFADTGREHPSWPAPRPRGAGPSDEEYSRVTNGTRYRILGARAEAWMLAAVDVGLALIERDVADPWARKPTTVVTRADRLVPVAPGAIALVVARSRLGGIDDAGVTLGAGDPAEQLGCVPHCGCDACDDGSDNEIRRLDVLIASVMAGARPAPAASWWPATD